MLSAAIWQAALVTVLLTASCHPAALGVHGAPLRLLGDQQLQQQHLLSGLETLQAPLLNAATDSQPSAATPQRGAARDVHLSAAAAVPTITGAATPALFAYASRVAVEVIQQRFHSVHLDAVHTEWSIPVIGSIGFDLTDIGLNALSIDHQETGLALSAAGALELAVTGLNAVVDCHFHYRRSAFPHVAGGGRARVTFQQGGLRLRLRVANDGAGHPQLSALEPAEVAFGGIQVHTYDAKLAWLYNLVTKLFDGQFRQTITAEVSSQVTELLPAAANDVLAGLPLDAEVQGLHLNISMAGDPQVDAQRLLVHDWGRFIVQGDDCPFQARRAGHPATPSLAAGPSLAHAAEASSQGLGSLPGAGGAAQAAGEAPGAPGSSTSAASRQGPLSSSSGAPMVWGAVDASLINCLTWVLWKQQVLQRRFVGGELPGVLNTAFWSVMVPALPQQYPGRDLALQVSLSGPLVTVVDPPAGINMSGNATLAFALADGAATHLFTLGLHAQLTASRWARSTRRRCSAHSAW